MKKRICPSSSNCYYYVKGVGLGTIPIEHCLECRTVFDNMYGIFAQFVDHERDGTC